jgi:hypothetical protein
MTAGPQIGYRPPADDPALYAVPGYLMPYGPPGGGSGRGPGVGPVIGWTLISGPFGAISAARRSDRARAAGDTTGKYWLAFGGTLVAGWVIGAVTLILTLATSGIIAGS